MPLSYACLRGLNYLAYHCHFNEPQSDLYNDRCSKEELYSVAYEML